MYICICAPTTDKQIKEAIASGADTLDALKMEQAYAVIAAAVSNR